MRKSVNQRLCREDWLREAIEVLAKEGGSILTIEALVRRLGVSRGSFYWHFKDRTDFIQQLVNYWSLIFTQTVAEEISQSKGSAEERLFSLMEQITVNQLNRYDIPIRAWASRDSAASRVVKKVDEFRFNYVRSLFEEIGFKGEELEMRTLIFVIFHSMEPGFFAGISGKRRLNQFKLRHAFFTRP